MRKRPNNLSLHGRHVALFGATGHAGFKALLSKGCRPELKISKSKSAQRGPLMNALSPSCFGTYGNCSRVHVPLYGVELGTAATLTIP